MPVRPDDSSSLSFPCWLDERHSAELLVPLRSKLGEDQLTLFVGEDGFVFVRDEEGVPPSTLAGCFECFPNALAGLGIQASELSIAANAVDVPVAKQRGDHD